MASKELERPDYEKLNTVEAVDQEMWRHKDKLSQLVRSQRRITQNKKDIIGGFNEQLKEIKEEVEHEAGVLDALEDRRKILHVQGNVVPIAGRG